MVIVVVYLSLFSIHQKHVQESINRQLSLQKSLYRAYSRVCVKASTRTLRWACSRIKRISFLFLKLNLANNMILKLKHKLSLLRSQVRVNEPELQVIVGGSVIWCGCRSHKFQTIRIKYKNEKPYLAIQKFHITIVLFITHRNQVGGLPDISSCIATVTALEGVHVKLELKTASTINPKPKYSPFLTRFQGIQ